MLRFHGRHAFALLAVMTAMKGDHANLVASCAAMDLPMVETTIVEGSGQTPTIKIYGDLPKPIELQAVDLAKLPRKTVRVKGQEGDELVYRGVALVDLLKAAGLEFGQNLRGPALANYLAVEAADGYKAVFALPELDSEWTGSDGVVLLVDQRDGKPLDDREGPFRVIAPSEQRRGRWVKKVIALKVGKAQ